MALFRWWVAAVLVSVSAAASWAEPVAFRRVAVPDDVPAHLVTAFAEDADGFLWIGTQGGLVRFDGTTFRVFAAGEEGAPAGAGLGGSYVRCLLPARDGRLWVGTFGGGLSLFDPASETFRSFRHDPADGASLANDRVEGLAEDGDGFVWAATGEGLERLDPGSFAITHFRHDPADPASLADDRVRAVLVDRAGDLWVGGRDGLQRRLPGGGFERIASAPGAPDSLAGEIVAKLFEDSAGRLWIGTAENGAAVLLPGGAPAGRALRRLRPRPADPDGLSHFWVYGFAEVSPDELWIATFGGGIDVVDPRRLTIGERLRADPSLPDALPGDRVGALLRDAAGLVWVGTWGQGLLLHDPATRAFRALRFSPNRPGGLSHGAAVRSLERRDGTVLVGTNGNGIDILSPALELVGGYRPAKDKKDALADGAVTCLAEGADGSLWVATLDGTLHRQRPGRTEFERFGTADGLPGGQIRALTFAPDGGLWAGSSEGLAAIDPRRLPAAGSIRAFRHHPEDPSSISGNAVEAIAYDAQGRLFLGTDSGLDLFDPATGQARAFLHQPGRPASLPNNWVPDLMLAADGTFWVGTHGGAALLRWTAGAAADAADASEPTFEPVAEKVGRPAAAVESLVEDAAGRVWLGPRLRVDPRTWQATAFGPADGCSLRTFFIASRCRRRDGTLLFGSPEGLLAVDPARLAPWTFAPKVVATALKVDGRVLPGAARRRTLELQPGQKSFSLDFAALDFTAPERNRYRYQLEGYDQQWQEADAAHRTLTYTNLRPGDYRLEVAGGNRAGLPSPQRLELAITVLPAFWQTALFRWLAALAVAAAAYGLYRLRLYQLERRSRALEQLVQERTAELREAYHRIEQASLKDPLTGLHNRRFLDQVMGADLDLALRRHRDGEALEGDLVFLLLDLDHFKSVNDTWGHAAGDAVLVESARRLRTVLRASDHLVRWGGEEFLAVARFIPREDAAALAEKLRLAIAAEPFSLPSGERLPRTVSIGYAAYPFGDDPEAFGWEKVLHFADLALYAAKHGGRNQCRAARPPADGAGPAPSEAPPAARPDAAPVLA